MQRTPCSRRGSPRLPCPGLYAHLKASATSCTASSLLLAQRKASALTVCSIGGSQEKTLESKRQIRSFRKRHSRTRIPSVVTSESAPVNSSVKSAPAKQETCFCKNTMLQEAARTGLHHPLNSSSSSGNNRKNKQTQSKAFILFKHFYTIQDSNTLRELLQTAAVSGILGLCSPLRIQIIFDHGSAINGARARQLCRCPQERGSASQHGHTPAGALGRHSSSTGGRAVSLGALQGESKPCWGIRFSLGI